MKFLRPELKEEFEKRTNPEATEAIEDLDDWSKEERLPEVVIVGLSRTPERNADLGGVPDSYHLSFCAIDIRDKHYTPAQKKSVMGFLARRCPKPDWELLEHNVRTGSHIHVARKDRTWRDDEVSPFAQA